MQCTAHHRKTEKKKSNDWNCMRNALWIYECISTHPDDVRQWPGPRYYTERSIVRDLQPIFTFDSIHFIINFSLYERARPRAYVCSSQHSNMCTSNENKIKREKKTPSTQKCSMRTIVHTDRMEREKGKKNTQAK